MPRKEARTTSSNQPADEPPGPALGDPEVVVVMDPAVDVRVVAGQVAADHPVGERLLAPIMADGQQGAGDDVRIRPLFSPPPARLRATLAPEADQAAGSLQSFFVVEGVAGREEAVAGRLREVDGVVGAYVKPPAAPPARTAAPASPAVNAMAPSVEAPPDTTPDFSSRQAYLGDAPAGVQARWAWTQQGGRGEGVRIIDVEGAWRLSHEDLVTRQIGVLAGTPSDDISWRNHGTAVVGVIAGDEDGSGVTGIAPLSLLRTVTIFGTGMSSSTAIKLAADALQPGDILLVELHRPGPEAGVVGQRGYIAVEWWPDDFAAIAYATSRSILVVEAAGNGGVDLDAAVYDQPQTGFPATWQNPFRRGATDSGAIVVGAGAPPEDVASGGWGPDRSRLNFSNYGSMVDAQGWGRDVVSCGYGDLQGGPDDEDRWYTAQFSGTSSASPIVTGSLACAQGILRATGPAQLTPATARQYLRATGSPQQAGPSGPASQRIGNRPDVQALVGQARGSAGQDQHDKGGDGKGGDGKSFAKLEKNEFKDLLEQGRPHGGDPGGTGSTDSAALGARVQAVEDAVAQLRHFISGEQRPDLTTLARRGPSADAEPQG